MARKTKNGNGMPSKLSFNITPELLTRIEDYQAQRCITTRTDALIELLEEGVTIYELMIEDKARNVSPANVKQKCIPDNIVGKQRITGPWGKKIWSWIRGMANQAALVCL